MRKQPKDSPAKALARQDLIKLCKEHPDTVVALLLQVGIAPAGCNSCTGTGCQECLEGWTLVASYGLMENLISASLLAKELRTVAAQRLREAVVDTGRKTVLGRIRAAARKFLMTPEQMCWWLFDLGVNVGHIPQEKFKK